ncbi:MAG: ankyrin repeat domain-containing protein [Acidiferrobacteraceae bacterium]
MDQKTYRIHLGRDVSEYLNVAIQTSMDPADPGFLDHLKSRIQETLEGPECGVSINFEREPSSACALRMVGVHAVDAQGGVSCIAEDVCIDPNLHDAGLLLQFALSPSPVVADEHRWGFLLDAATRWLGMSETDALSAIVALKRASLPGVFQKTHEKEGALAAAIRAEANVEIVDRLLAAGADPCEGESVALRLAVKQGSLDIVDRLLNAGAYADAFDGEALRAAADNDDLNIVDRLLKAGANPRAGASSALRIAALNGHRVIVERLLKAGADANANNGEALYWASSRGHGDICDLLRNGVTPTTRKSHSPRA